ncbi:IPT/TIG domain-containing protein [Ekhidna sp.]|uniref:IPT/TIG domain-containing protein n=1 Tax=Ekhidna sp. TaxID=2608089 RepID=UPI003BA95990
MQIKSHTLVCVFLILLVSCTEDEIGRPYPRVITEGVSNVSEKGAVFKGRISSYGKEEISSIGFVWSLKSSPNLNSSTDEMVYMSLDDVKGNQFQFELRSTLEPDEKYWVRAFATQGDLRIFGDTTSFISSGSFSNPVVQNFEPKSGTDSTEIIISGEGFSHKPSENLVFFNSLQASVVESNTEELKVLVPAGIETRESSLKVLVTGNEFEVDGKFIREAPEIISVSPIKSACGTAITINGSNFSTLESGNKVYFGDIPAQVVSYSSGKIIAIVPNGLSPDPLKIRVEVAGQMSISSTNFDSESPIVSSFSPTSGTDNDEITIVGSNFGNSPEGVKVFFDELEANVVSVISNKIIATVPANISTSEVDLIVEVGCSAPDVSAVKFHRLAPEITDFNPKSVSCSEIVTITGSNFGTALNANKVLINGNEVTIIGATSNALEVLVPIGVDGSYNIQVITASQADISDEQLEIVSDALCAKNLIAFYPFNGNANDESNNSNHGVVNGAILTTDRNGEQDAAYQFDGINDYISLGTSNVFSLGEYSEFTISVWILNYTATIANNKSETVFSKYISAGNNRIYDLYLVSDHNLRFAAWENGASSNRNSVENPVDNNWNHLAIVNDGNDYIFYLNSTEVARTSKTFEIKTSGSTSVETLLGALRFSKTNYDGPFNGKIDDFMLFNRALSASEIVTLYD